MTLPGQVGRTARLLGYAGLLPQVACVSVILARRSDWIGFAIATAILYAGLILSFLGGIWWGFAMRRERGRHRLAIVAVVPSLAALAIGISLERALNAGVAGERCYLWAALALGLCQWATVPIDARLERRGEAPPGWTRFRLMLSLGLGGLTMAAGVLFHHWARTVTYI
ncbi:DUF3429 domain-containing protein [uncultured Sphingomonas sp.]|uniref:DUF3429 domain-containing protein n=1 Tax=uncultured Sphingomonas sp. TaxID=158754 RepID=UPI0035CC8801